MDRFYSSFLVGSAALGGALALFVAFQAPDSARGEAENAAATAPVFGDWRADRPGLRHRIRIEDLPPPYETRSASNPPQEVERRRGAKPSAPEGFEVSLFAEGLEQPRTLRAAPNGDIFVAETAAGNVRVLRPDAGGASVEKNALYASGLTAPFGLAFYPAGPNPEWLYVAENNRVIRFPYANGDLKPRSKPEVVVPRLAPTSGGHVTRDVVFSKDGARMFVSVGSESNVAEGMRRKSAAEIEAWDAQHGLGAAWGDEENRGDVLVFTPEGKEGRAFATGLRNCVGLAVHPGTGDLYCSTNERDGLGDNLAPDYVTRVREGAFFGWPWRYMGDREDPRWKGARPDLKGKVTDPDVLIQPHSAPLGMTFYTGASFPPEYRGAAFASLHGSWNRAKRTGYKVVRIVMRDGQPTGEYEDFLTGFVVDAGRVWGRPVGVETARDGALLVSEDANGTIWRIAAKNSLSNGRE
jgi:glucose/arabinose dehydrogenase